ncbi:MAG: hypothetical protein E7165_03805 [Firmicutes bacterium]|nr:hypothetical protein [Bacillota bacterium]
MFKWFKEHVKICYVIYLFIVIVIGVVFCLTYKKPNIAYSIEFEAKSKFILYFNSNNIVIKTKCLNEFCEKDIKVNEFIETNYNDLERQLNFTLYNELNNKNALNIKLASGQKDITNLIETYKQKGNDNTNNKTPDIKEPSKEENNSNNIKDESDKKENISNKVESKPSNNQNNNNKVESKPNNNQNNNVENNTNNDTNQEHTPTITPLDIEIIWIPTSYSYYKVSFDSYSVTPMGYNKKNNGAVPYKYGSDISGYMQIFDLKSQGITTDDACITFTQNKYYNHEASATTIVPLYNNKNVTYRKFCLGFDEDPYYYSSYNSIATSINNSSNVYEWIDNKWTFLGTLGNVKFTERNSQGYTQNFSVLDYIDLAYDRIMTEQYPAISIKQRNELKKIDEEEKTVSNIMDEKWQELGNTCGPSSSDDITYECELKYAELSNEWTYERGIIEEKRSEILSWDFESMYDFSILDEK